MNREELERFMEEKLQSLTTYCRVTNSIYGVLAFTLGFAIIDTNNPMEFGNLTILFLGVFWLFNTSPQMRDIWVLQKANHDATRLWSMLKLLIPSVLGMSFLALVAFGIIDENGFLYKSIAKPPICVVMDGGTSE